MRGRKKWLALFLAVVMCLGAVYSDAFVWQTEAATGTGKTMEASEIDSYGSQLMAEQQDVYKKLVKYYIGEDGLSNGTLDEQMSYVFEKVYATSEEANQAANKWPSMVVYSGHAFLKDYPQMYWANQVGADVSGNIYHISYADGSEEYKLELNTIITMKNSNEDVSVTQQAIEVYNVGIKAAVEEICTDVPDGSSEYVYYKAIHDWICKKASYHYDAAKTPSSYPWAFTSQPLFDDNEEDNQVVCEGYGEAYKILCDQLRMQKGIPLESMTVVGTGGIGTEAGAHMWNYVQMPDQKWYGVDATWDDQKDNTYYNYFLCGRKSVGFYNEATATYPTFQEDHLPDGNLSADGSVQFNYPDVATYGYGGYYFVSTKLNLSDKIGIKFVVSLDEIISDSDFMKITVGDNTTNVLVSDATQEMSSVAGKMCHVFACRLNAKEMAKEIQVQMVVGGVAHGTPITYSAKKYGDAILGYAEGTFEKEKTLVRAMLNYGGYAQVFFDNATSGLANEGLYSETNDPVLTSAAPDLNAYAGSSTQISNSAGLDLEGTTLVLESETELRMYFTLDSGKDLNDYTFQIAQTGKILTTGYSDEKKQYYVSIPNIKATELQKMYDVTIKTTSDTEVAKVRYGALSYVKQILDGAADSSLLETKKVQCKNLVKALYLYNQAALTYIGATEG